MPAPQPRFCSLPNCQGSEQNDPIRGWQHRTAGSQLLTRGETSHEAFLQRTETSIHRTVWTPQWRGQGERGCRRQEKESQRVRKWRLVEERAQAGGTMGKICQYHVCLSLLWDGREGTPAALGTEHLCMLPCPHPSSPAQARGGCLVSAHQSCCLC